MVKVRCNKRVSHHDVLVVLSWATLSKFQDGRCIGNTRSALWAIVHSIAQETGDETKKHKMEGSGSGLSRVRPEHKFDEASLHEYLKENLPGFPTRDGSLTILQYRFVVIFLESWAQVSEQLGGNTRTSWQILNSFSLLYMSDCADISTLWNRFL